jgi:hypothetical protein
VAGLPCYRPGDRSRLIYRLRLDRARMGETKAFTWTEYRDLLLATHRQLPGGNIVLIWDTSTSTSRPSCAPSWMCRPGCGYSGAHIRA